MAEASFSPEESEYHVDNRSEAEANARLIAAAPELLAALRALDEACRIADANEGLPPEVCGSLLDAACAAIAKAAGGL